MVTRKIQKSFCFLLMLGFFALPAFSLDVPKLEAPIMDKADIINSSDEMALNQKLTNLSNETGIQVAVLTIPSLEGEALESYSMKVVEDWKLGQKGVDNGVLLLVSVGDKELRIETGYGVEGDLTDTKCGLIIRNVITPHFQNDDMSKGIVQGVTAIVENVASDFSENAETPIDIEDGEEGAPIIVLVCFFIFAMIIVVAASSKAKTGSVNGDLKTVIAAKTIIEVAKALSSSGDDHFGGFSGGGFGGFSGGGGSFGGGGASGSW
ncbi:MAG: TPM domain-containing protein [Spirochaetaceae bacterium]|nr:TPM domain-containing protein [Spirochaetaceae bacterium]